MIIVNCSFCSWQEECKTPCFDKQEKKKEEENNFEEIFQKELDKLKD